MPRHAVPLPRDRGRRDSAPVRCRRQGWQGGGEEPGVEEVVELLAADLLGERDEVLRRRVPVVEVGGPGAQDGEECLVAETQPERVQCERAAFIDDRRGEELSWTGIAGARGRAGEIVRRDPERRNSDPGYGVVLSPSLLALEH